MGGKRECVPQGEGEGGGRNDRMMDSIGIILNTLMFTIKLAQSVFFHIFFTGLPLSLLIIPS